MDCEKIREDLAAFIDGELEEGRVAGIESHLADCQGCREELEMMRQTARTLEEFLEPRAMRESVADGVMAAIASERRKRPVPLITRVGWALTGAVAAVLILAVFGLLNMEAGGTGAFADEIVDEALADHSNTFELIKKQVVNSAVRDPKTGVRLIRIEIQLSGLREKTIRLEKLLASSSHPQKLQIEKYISRVHEFLGFAEDPPLGSPQVIFHALRKEAMDISPMTGVQLMYVAEPGEVKFEMPADLDNDTRIFVLAKQDLYSGNFARAASSFAVVARQAPESQIAEDARYWKVYADFHGGAGEVEIVGDFEIPDHAALRKEMRKDFLEWIEYGKHGHRPDPQKFRQMLEVIGRKVGVDIETSVDEQGNTVIKVERKDARGNSATSVIKMRSSVGAGDSEGVSK